MGNAPFLVLGANGGIGEALTHILASDGKDVIATARNKDGIAALPAQVLSVDVTNPEEMSETLSGLPLGNGLSGFAYCIGSIDLKPFSKTSDEDILKAFEVNHMGIVRALRVLQPALKKAQGSVTLFSSIAVQNGFSAHTSIASAKGAVEGLTRTLGAEWAPDIRVNCIAPSLTDTSIAKSLTSSEQMASAIAKMHPIPRLGQAQDAAELAAFLLSDRSSWITGQVIALDGGRSTLRPRG